MSIMNEKANVTTQPSPIPTARGSRSAANDILSQYLDESDVVPELYLPKATRFSYVPSLQAHDPIDYRLLVTRDVDSVDKLVRSAKELGALRIVHHDISATESRLLVREIDNVYGMLMESDRLDFRRNVISKYGGSTQEVVWTMEYNGSEEYQIQPSISISRRMEDLCSKMDTIATELDQILSTGLGKKFNRGNKFGDSILSLCRHEHLKVDEVKAYPFAVTFYISVEQCEFTLRSDTHSVSFDASPDTIIISFGKQLKDKFQMEIESTSGDIGLRLNHDGHTHFIEYKCSPPLLYQSLKGNYKTINLVDQILIILGIVCFFNLLAYSLNKL